MWANESERKMVLLLHCWLRIRKKMMKKIWRQSAEVQQRGRYLNFTRLKIFFSFRFQVQKLWQNGLLQHVHQVSALHLQPRVRGNEISLRLWKRTWLRNPWRSFLRSFQLSGLAIIIVGGVLLANGSDMADLLEDVQTELKAPQIVLIVVGVIIFVIAFLGCCGAVKESRCMLITVRKDLMRG